MLGTHMDLANGLRVLVDWIDFTITKNMEVHEVIDFLGYAVDQFSKRSCGGRGYKDSLQLKGYSLLIYYNGNEGMGIHVSISGSCITNFFCAFQKRYSVLTPFGSARDTVDLDSLVFLDFLKRVQSIGHFTRLDVAVDDIGAKYFSVHDVVCLMDNLSYVSRFRKWTQIKTCDSNGLFVGHTVNLGSRQSEIFLRVYDKQLEQNSKIENADNKIKNKWVRWELELKQGRAQQFVAKLLSGLSLGDTVVGVLSYYFRFINLDNVQKFRCSTLALWEEFTCSITKLRLAVTSPITTYERKKLWLKRSVAPTLYAVSEIEGSTDMLYDLLEYGSLKQNALLRDMVLQYA